MRQADGAWAVPAGHPALTGHFPGRPIVPGVVLLDRALLFAEALLGRPGLAWQIAQAKFFRPVGPGETLVFRLQEQPDAALTFSIRAGASEVASGRLRPAG
ncbi:hypothetical protein [Accumulibacter sp.]|uniref:hypothetical protein n=1 Tax=Accumulibacter sp. TaxID=2053492 RepID=UPI00261956BF|nr:hypothetical protein [Accumulibacter sp.]